MPAAYAAQWIFVLGGRGRVGGFSSSVDKWKLLPPEARLLDVRWQGDPALDLASNKILLGALSDKEPRIRAAGITALIRRKVTDAAPAILPLVADADPIVAHLAVTH
jgi:hypothetical protein